VYELYRLRDWIEHCYKPAKHELGWADYQMRSERAMLRHWQLVLLAYTFSLLLGVPNAPADLPGAGGKITTHRGAGGVERHAAARPRLAVPTGPPPALLAALVGRAPSQRARRAPRPRRPLSVS
jgi:hypothetical protein